MENEVKLLLELNLYEDILSITESGIDFSGFKNKTVMVSGASQLVGFYTVCAFLISNDLYGTNIKVIAVDRDDSLFKRFGKLTQRSDIDFLISKDFSNLSTVDTDFFIHTLKPAAEIEISNIINYVKASKASTLINSFSDIYGDVFNGKDSISEKDSGYLNCQDPGDYTAMLQRLFESSAKLAAEEFNLDIKFSRLCQVFGYREYGNNPSYIKIFNNVADKKNIEIEKSDKTLSSYIYVTDAASALIKVLVKGEKNEIYNISSGYVASNYIIAQYCVKLFENLKLEIIFKDEAVTLSPIAPTIDVLDNSKLKSLGFENKTDIKTGIVKAIKIIYETKG